jgi:V/A-type H+-transporting ATPase subunit I
MHKVLFVGPENQKNRVLADLQGLGVIEITGYKAEQKNPNEANEVSRVSAEHLLEVYNFLKRYKPETAAPEPAPGKQVNEAVEEIEALRKELFSLQFSEELIRDNINKTEKWGSFDLEMLNDIQLRGNMVVQFWICAGKYESCHPGAVVSIEINSDNSRRYFITIAVEKLELSDCEEVRFEAGLDTLERELQDNLNRQKDIAKELKALTVYLKMFFSAYQQELDRLSFEQAKLSAGEALDGKLFTLQGWCPAGDYRELERSMKKQLVETMMVHPDPGEKEPTLMVNRGAAAMGTDLVNIYDTPSYRDWDPSSWVFFSFVMFFAMIIADGGYGLILLVISLFLKIRFRKAKTAMRRFINMSLILSIGTMVFGIASGAFFGLSENNRFFGWLISRRLFDGNEIGSMMNVSIIIGLLHVSISLLLKCFRTVKVFKNYISPFSQLAWIVVIWTYYIWCAYYKLPEQSYYALSGNFLYTFGGALAVVFLTSAGTFQPLKLIAGGLGGLYSMVQFFSDVLSYLRLFALGLAGSLLAQTFNGLALDIWKSGIAGMVFAVVIFLLGHTVNLALCIMSGVIHGLRLNFLEWYRWSFDGDGKAFKPFRLLIQEMS